MSVCFSSSFIIVSQPRFGVNPVVIYDRKPGCAEYTVKISVILVSLLHDFIQSHPNFIDLYDIGKSNQFKLTSSSTNLCRVEFMAIVNSL